MAGEEEVGGVRRSKEELGGVRWQVRRRWEEVAGEEEVGGGGR